MTIAEGNAMSSGMAMGDAEPVRGPVLVEPSILPIGGRRLKASHAAKELGCSSDTVIREIKKGNLKGFIGTDGRYYTTDAWLTAYFLRNNKSLRHKISSKDRSMMHGASSLKGVNDTQQRGECWQQS